MEHFLVVDDEEHVIKEISKWALMMSEGSLDFTVTAVSDESIAMDYLTTGFYSGLITDFYLDEDCKTNAFELIRVATEMGVEVVVYSSQKWLKEHKAMFERNKIDFRVRGDSTSFYVDLAIQLVTKCRRNKVEKFIRSELLILKETQVDKLTNCILDYAITCKEPLAIVGPKGSRKCYTAKKIIEFIGGLPTVTSAQDIGDLTTVKRKRFLVVKDYDKMPEFRRKKIKNAIESNIFKGVIYTCGKTETLDSSFSSERMITFPTFHKRKNEVPLIAKRIFGISIDQGFIDYVISEKLNMNDLVLIKEKLPKVALSTDLIKIHQDIKLKKLKELNKKQKIKRKTGFHNTVKDLINEGLSLKIIAKRYGVSSQCIWKIRKEMVNENA